MTLDKDKDYRHKNIIFALYELRPNAKWSFSGEVYEGLDWKDDTQTKPTETELFEKVTELENAEPYRLLREERNRRLQATDWRASSDLTISGDWKAYRQDLRDLPAQQTPKLNSDYELDPSSISWPPEPSS
jgi:hypothetical protein